MYEVWHSEIMKVVRSLVGYKLVGPDMQHQQEVHPKALRAHSATAHCTFKQRNYAQVVLYLEFPLQPVDQCDQQDERFFL